jgi:hypothetical protein
MVAVVGLTVAVVILATDSDEVSSTSSARPMESIRYDGGPEEGTRGIVPAQQPSARYDGGPEEGTADIARPFAPAAFDANPIESAPGVRYDGGPEEGTRGIVTASAPSARYDGGPEEGTALSGSRP